MTAALAGTVAATALLLAASVAAGAQSGFDIPRDLRRGQSARHDQPSARGPVTVAARSMAHAPGPDGGVAQREQSQPVPNQDAPAPTHDHVAPTQDPAAPEHNHAAPERADAAAQELPAFVPRPTNADREAAFPDVDAHTMHGTSLNSFVLFDQLEWHAGDTATGFDLDSRGWVGGDRDRLWFRAEGDDDGGRLGEAQAHVLFGRQFARWWDLVAGVRQEFRPGPAQTWAAVGIQGLAPYWFEVEATAYVGASGRTQARLALEYELLLTNRLILQPLLEMDFTGKSDPERRVGAGLSATDLGIRLRYEWRREVAPYVGLTWSRKWGGTADFARADGDAPSSARLATGLRLWF